MIPSIRKKTGFLVLFLIITTLSLLPERNMAKAAGEYEIITLNGLTIGLWSTKELDGSVVKLASVFSINEDCMDYAVDGIFKIPSIVVHEAKEYIVYDVDAQFDIPEEIKEIVIQEADGAAIDYKGYLRCGIMNVEKITILSEKVRMTPRVVAEDSIDYWSISALDTKRLKTVDIKSQNVILDRNLFYGCESLKEVCFEADAVLELNRGAFTKCPNLKSLILPSGTTYCEGAIIEGSFEKISFAEPSSKYGITDGCIISKKGKRLLYVPPTATKFTVPERITEIGQFAFASCKNLSEVNATGKNLSKINKYAFYNREALTKITLGKGLKVIGNYAFQNSNLKELILPASVKKIGHGIVQKNKELKKIIVDSKSKYFKVSSGILLTKSGKTVKAAIGRSTLEIPKGVTTVCAGFISDANLVKEIRYPSTLKLIYLLSGTENLEKLVFLSKVPPEFSDANVDYGKRKDEHFNAFSSRKSISVVIPKGTTKAYKNFMSDSYVLYSKITES